MRPGVLSIVIVSYNTCDLLRRCLLSVTENPDHTIVAGETGERQGEGARAHHPAQSTLPCEIVVVDNASSDGSAEMVAREFPTVGLIRSTTNLGFASATNLGIGRSGGEWVLLLNPDAEIVGDALLKMTSFLASNARAAAVGPSLVYPDGSPQHGAFRFPTHWMTLLDFFPVNHRLMDSRINGRYRAPADGRPYPVDHVLGAAMMLSRAALSDVGPLDEAFFIYCEEVDWSIRTHRRGWRIYHLPVAKVIHHSGKATGQVRDQMLVELWRSRYLLYAKHYSAGFARVERLIVRAGLARRLVSARWDAFRGRTEPSRLQRQLRAYRAIWSM